MMVYGMMGYPRLYGYPILRQTHVPSRQVVKNDPGALGTIATWDVKNTARIFTSQNARVSFLFSKE